MYTILSILFIAAGLLLVIFILLRKGEGGVLSGAFGGVGGETAFGVKAAKHLDRVIGVIAFIFLACAILMNINTFRKKGSRSAPEARPTEAPASPAPTDPAGTGDSE